MATEKARDERTRNWTFIVYPIEGNPPAPANWRDIIDAEHIAWAESPLHEYDTNPDGEVKRPHIHVLVTYEGKKSYSQVKELTDKLNAPQPQKCASARGMVRYFIHLDNPEKYQYDRADIIGHGGFDVAEYLKPTSSSRYQLIKDMMSWCDDNHVVEISDLIRYAMEKHFDDWFPLLCDSCAYVMGAYLKSLRHGGENVRRSESGKDEV